MKAVFLETALTSDRLVYGIVCDVRRDEAVEGSIEIGDGNCIWKVRDASFYDGECRTIVTKTK